MKKERFRELIEDLYRIYNPTHLQYLDFLTDKYYQMPSEAIEMTFQKYNSPNVSHHDPNKNTEAYRQMLIEKYAAGERVLQNADLLSDAQRSQEEIEKQRQELEQQEKERQAAEAKRKQEEEERRAKEVAEEKERLKKELEEVKKIKEQLGEKPQVVEVEKEKEPDLAIDIQTNVEGKLNLPDPRILSSMGVGARLVTTTEKGDLVGLVVKDILLDHTTVEFMGKPSLMIIMEKK